MKRSNGPILAAALYMALPGIAFAMGRPAVVTVEAPISAAKVDQRIAAAGAIDATKDGEASLAAWLAAADAARRLRPADPMRLATALNGTADPAYNLFNRHKDRDPTKALRDEIALLIEARDLLRANGLTRTDLYIELMSNLGAMYAPLPDYDAAEAAQREGIALGETMYGRDSPKLSHNYFNLGMLLFREKHYGEAADYVGRSARIRAISEPDLPDTVSALGTATQVSADAGRISDAEDLAVLGVSVAARLPENHPFRGYALAQLGEVYRRQGRYADALPPLKAGVDQLGQYAGKTHTFTRRALLSLARTLAATGHFDEARVIYRELAKVFISNHETMTTRIELARTDAELGDDAAAMTDIDSALSFTNKGTFRPADSLDHAEAAGFKADLLTAQGRIAEAIVQAEVAERGYSAQFAATNPLVATAQVRLGWLRMQADDRTGYVFAVEAGKRLEAVLFDAGGLGEGALEQAAAYRDSFLRLALAHHAAGDDAQALHALQLATFDPGAAAIAQQAMIEAAASQSNGRSAAVRLKALRRQAMALRIERDQAYLDAQPTLAAAVAARLAAVREEAAETQRRLFSADPKLLALERPDHTALAEVRAVLSPRDAIVFVVPSTFFTLVAVINSTSMQIDARPLNHYGLRDHVIALRRSVQVGGDGSLAAFDTSAAYRLYRDLFIDKGGQGGIDRLGRTRKLWLIAEAEAGTVPFAMLLTKPTTAGTVKDLRRAPWLLRRTSISVLASLNPRKTSVFTNAIPFVGVGAPALQTSLVKADLRGYVVRGGVADLGAVNTLPALPATVGELTRLRKALGGGIVYIGDQAREPAVTALKGKSIGVLAFATHALLGGQVTGLEEPALVLTPPQVPSPDNDGLLRASEIMGLDLKADWVVLSACDTAAGSTDAAAGFRGLSQAFLYGGANTILASQWAVRDDAVAPLTVATTAARNDGAAALRRAELRMIGDRNHPEYAHPALWAPFVVIGALPARPPS